MQLLAIDKTHLNSVEWVMFVGKDHTILADQPQIITAYTTIESRSTATSWRCTMLTEAELREATTTTLKGNDNP
jgi:hypothetical protein